MGKIESTEPASDQMPVSPPSYEAVIASAPIDAETQPLREDDDVNSTDGLVKPTVCFTVMSAICCLPIGIFTIYFHNKATAAYQKRNVERLDKWAKCAKWSGAMAIVIGEFIVRSTWTSSFLFSGLICYAYLGIVVSFTVYALHH